MKISTSVLRLLLLPTLGAVTLAMPALSHAETHVNVGIGVGVPLPHGYTEVHVGHDRYYYHRGVYYRPGPHGYYVVRAPRGAYIHTLPPYYSRVYVGGTYYYRYGDVYYQPYHDGYIVVDPPPAVVASIPAPVKEEPQMIRV